MSLQENSKVKVAYITTSFSSLSHTFIRREVEHLTASGIDVDLFGVRPDLSSDLLDSKTQFLYPISILKTLISLVKIALTKPNLLIHTFVFAIFNEETNPYKHLKLIYHFFIALRHAEKIIANNYSHIHAHFINVPTTIAMYCSKLSGVPYSFTCHSAGELGLADVIGIKAKFKNASFVRVIAEYVKEDLKSYRKDLKVIRCGLNFTKITLPIVDKSKAPFTILAVGRLVEKKGFTYLVQAIAEIKSPVNLLIIGEGPELNNLKKLVSEYKLDQKVKFLLNKSATEVQKVMTEVDLLVVPSVTAASGEKEGLPTVIVEAMSLCLPVVASAHSGIPELVIHEKTGLLVNEKDVKTLSESIDRLLTDTKLRETIVPQAYNHAKNLFDIGPICQELINLFQGQK